MFDPLRSLPSTATTLDARGEYAILKTPSEVVAYRLDGERLYAWPRPRPAEQVAGEEAQREDEDEDERQERSVTSLVLDPIEPRLALLWNRHRPVGRDREVWCSAYSSEVELVDLANQASLTIGAQVAHVEALVGIAPDGALLTESSAAGLSAFRAFRATREDAIVEMFLDLLPKSRFDPQAGALTFALGFSALPHAQQLVFSEDSGRALSGSSSHYRPHLALLELGVTPRVLRDEPIEVIEIVALPGFERAVVLETGHAGPRRVSLWDVEAFRRTRSLLDETSESVIVRGMSVDPSGAVVALMSDGTAVCASAASDVVRRFRVGEPRDRFHAGSLVPGELAVDFSARRFATCADGRVAFFDFEGEELAPVGRGDAVYAHDGRLFVVSGAEVTIADGGKRAWTGDAPILVATASARGLVVVDERRRLALVTA